MSKAESALKSRLEAMKALGQKDPMNMWDATSHNILHGELGYFDNDNLPNYKFSDEVRDRVLRHARQDTAHAVIAAEYAFTMSKKCVLDESQRLD